MKGIKVVVLSMLIITHAANLQAMVELFLNNNEQLIESVKKGDKQRVKELLDQGINSNVEDKNGQSPLHWAASNGTKEITQILIDHGASVNTTNNIGSTPLHMAAWADVAILIAHGASVNAVDNNAGYRFM
jgi:ankyrin repeat protein